MLLQVTESEFSDNVFFKRELCCKGVKALVALAALKLIDTTPITPEVINQLPYEVIDLVAKEVILLKNESQLYRLMKNFPQKVFNLGDIVKACCGACYNAFSDGAPENVTFATNVFLSVIRQEKPETLRELDQSFFENSEQTSDWLLATDETRKAVATTEVFKIISSFVLRKKLNSSNVETIHYAFETLQNILEFNDVSTIRVDFKKILLCKEAILEVDRLCKFMNSLNADLKGLYITHIDLFDRYTEFLSLLGKFKSLNSLDIEETTGQQRVTTEYSKKLGAVLAGMPHLASLDLTKNIIGGNLRHILCGVSRNLRLLDLSYTELTLNDILFLANHAPFQPSLSHLNLTGNNFSGLATTALDYLMDTIRDHIHTLYLQNVKLEAPELLRAIDIVTDKTTLQQLDISANDYKTGDLLEILELLVRAEHLRFLLISWPLDACMETREETAEAVIETINRDRDHVPDIELNIVGHLGTYSVEC